MFGKPKTVPSASDALPGRAERMPVPTAHFVNGHRLSPPFSRRLRTCNVRPGLLLGRGEEVLAAVPAWTRPQSGTWPDTHPTRRIARSAAGMTGHSEVVLRRLRPEDDLVPESLLKGFWENHDPTQGMRQGNDVGTQYRSGIYCYGDVQRAAAERSRDMYQQKLIAAGYGPITTEDSSRARVLLRRGLPPAGPREGSQTVTVASAVPASPVRSACRSRVRPRSIAGARRRQPNQGARRL